jgi:hypothetical protein
MLRSKFCALLPACCAAPLLVAAISSCSAGGSVGDEGDGTGSSGQSGGGFIGGESGSGNMFGGSSGPDLGGGQGCNQLTIAFESTTPTALIVVDRSSSQWDGEPNENWDPVKQGLINVIEQVQNDINIGLFTYTGQNPQAQNVVATCPELIPAPSTVTFSKGNAGAIRDALNAVQKPSYKGETPTAMAIDAAIPLLAAAPAGGEKFILLVTDGDPDFCNDGDQICPMDAVVAAVQKAKAQNIGTTVFGLQRNGVALSGQHLQDVANAGAGLPVAQPIQRLEDFQGRCQGPALGTYAPMGGGGTASFFQANATNQQALADALDQVIAGIRSCTFELAGAVKVDLNRAAQANISIDATPLAYGDPNGWRMVSETQVEIMGAGCAQLKDKATQRVDFDFPCEIVSPR